MYKFLPSGVFTIEPYSSGSLSGLNFSIKDNINIAQYKTSYGSPSWQVNIRLPFIRHCCKNVEVIGEHEKPRGSHRMMPSTGVKITTIIS
ncbi:MULTISPECIES: hypothetical protein [Klebsiella pneumoniae complex]|uniref:hypothetical protein n=1 Tax=Klebsiella pneumoniae complex TaxID=3390273 RepID=UPI000FEBE2F3|nr:hypothetical protein [Klebsiella quasipneumoniae]EEF4858158.1 hypothetical protein [Salmonella enterica]EEF4859368.1 hypothetical protein [Salmonella enterica]MBT0604470.1 hypothetical protein [Klebsiella quasipneumoniae]